MRRRISVGLLSAVVLIVLVGSSVSFADQRSCSFSAQAAGPTSTPSCFVPIFCPSGTGPNECGIVAKAHIDGIGLVSVVVSLSEFNGPQATDSCGPNLNTCEAVASAESRASGVWSVVCSLGTTLAVDVHVTCTGETSATFG